MANDISSVLGKSVDYKDKYNPEILAREERQNNRSQYGLDSKDLPFHGVDAWHGYEASFLVAGFPVNGILKLIFPCTSKYIVESKSLKLYLFSYMMEDLYSDEDTSLEDAVIRYENRIRKDLSELIEAPVKVKLHKIDSLEIDSFGDSRTAYMDLGLDLPSDRSRYTAEYKENPSILVESIIGADCFEVKCDALRSACKITHQPDFGTIYISYKGTKLVDLDSLYRYIVSFRNEYHFHEEIVEAVYSRLWERFHPQYLEVTAFYTRRGGLDICPTRCSNDTTSFSKLTDIAKIGYREARS